MKRTGMLILALLAALTLLPPPVCAQTAGGVLEDTLTDRLTSKDEVKWYCFEMSQPGDAILTVFGLQERWDGWTTHWTAAIYASDRQTVLASASARGYNGNEYSSPARLSLLDLDSGTYYVRISNVSDLYFTTDPFRLELERTYQSQQSLVRSEDGTYVMGDEAFDGRLTAPDQAQRYTFQMTEPGNVLLCVTGLQDHWDGYAYHWRCTVYAEDLETVLARATIRGYAENSGPDILSIPDLQPGTYFVQMTSTSSANPLLTSFTSDPYRIQLCRYYHSLSPTYNGDGVQRFQSAGDVLWAMEGTAFIKCSDGECFMALMQTKHGAVVPILIGAEETAVEYISSRTGEIVPAEGPFRHQDSETDYYYSSCEGIQPYTDRIVKASDLPVPLVDTKSASAGAQAVADLHLEEQLGKNAYWWLKNAGTVKIVCGIGVGLAVLILLGKLIGTDGSGGGSDNNDEIYNDYTGSVSEAVSEWWSDGV